jgi:hypothetical protein
MCGGWSLCVVSVLCQIDERLHLRIRGAPERERVHVGQQRCKPSPGIRTVARSQWRQGCAGWIQRRSGRQGRGARRLLLAYWQFSDAPRGESACPSDVERPRADRSRRQNLTHNFANGKTGPRDPQDCAPIDSAPRWRAFVRSAPRSRSDFHHLSATCRGGGRSPGFLQSRQMA